MLAVQAIIENEEGLILFRKRHKEPDLGKWELIAGYVEPGERLVETVARKMREKVGVENTQTIEFTGRYYDEPNRHSGTSCIPFVFKVRVRSQDVPLREGVQWFSQEEIGKLDMALDNSKSLEDYFSDTKKV